MKCRFKFHRIYFIGWICIWISLLVPPTFQQGPQREYGGQSIVPGGFQQQIFPSHFPGGGLSRNSRVGSGPTGPTGPTATSVQNQQFGFFPAANIRNPTSKQIGQPNFFGLPFPQSPAAQSVRAPRPHVVATNGDVQYEYYDEPEEDLIYQYGTDINDRNKQRGGSQNKATVGKGIHVLDSLNQQQQQPKSSRQNNNNERLNYSNLPPQSITAQLGSKSSSSRSSPSNKPSPSGYLRETSSSFIPLIGQDEEPEPILALNGRSVQPNTRLNNLPIRPHNGLLRSTNSPSSTEVVPTKASSERSSSNNRSRGGFNNNRSSSSVSSTPSPTKVFRSTTKRPGVLRSNRFTLTARPPPASLKTNNKSVDKEIVLTSSSTYRPESSSVDKSRRGNKEKYVLNSAGSSPDSSSDDYTVEYVEYPASPEDDKSAFEYYEVSEETAAALLANRTRLNDKSKERTKSSSTPTKVSSSVTVSKSTSTTATTSSTTTTAPPTVLSSEEGDEIKEGKSQVIISVSTTKSISGSKLSKEVVTRPSSVESTSRVRPTGASVVVASVQTSQSVIGGHRPTEPSRRQASTEGLQDSIPSGANTSPEYYEEEYSYPDNFPVLNSEAGAGNDPTSSNNNGQQQSTLTSVSSNREAKSNEENDGTVLVLRQDSHEEQHQQPQPRKLPSKSREEIQVGHFETLIDPGELESDQRIPIIHEQHLQEEEEEERPSSSTTTTTTTTTTTESSKSVVPISGIKFAEISPNLLPPGFKFPSLSDVEVPSTTSTTTTTTTTTPSPVVSTTSASINFDEIPSFLLPKGYKPLAPQITSATSTSTTTSTTETPSSSSEAPIQFEQFPVGLLPKGYRPFSNPSETSTTALPKEEQKPTNPLEALLSKVQFKEIAIPDLIPKDYKPPVAEEPTKGIKFETPANLLPPGFKPPTDSSSGPPAIKFDTPANFLPPGFKLGATPEVVSIPTESTTTKKPGGLVFPTKSPSSGGIVYPTKPGGFRVTRPTTTEGPKANTPPPPRIQIGGAGGWPTRKTTEFTGWPTSSTTPAPSTSSTSTTSTTTETPTTTPTTTTTTPPPPKRSPLGVCPADVCRMEATIRITGGVKWKPEFADINTEEYKQLDTTVKRELDGAFRASGLAPWYKRVQIEGFNRGSVLVDYFVELENVDRELTTSDVVKVFHKSLLDSDPGDEPPIETDAPGQLPQAALRFGRYSIDPRYTDFKVVNQKAGKGTSQPEPLIPQWGIAVIVIGVVSLLFVFILGVIVLVSRYKNSKKKNAVSLTQEMLNEFNKSHIAAGGGGGGAGGVDNFGADDLYNMDDVWNDKQMDRTFDRRPTKRSQGSTKGSAQYNIYDSWKTEWNGYYYNGNYYGDSGYAPSRRRSDYDTNF